jgi:ABC-type transport system involved in multi-copper enzyme maturation permease subunit
MSSEQPSANWLTRVFPWSNRWADWQERLIGLGILSIGLTLAILSATTLTLWPAVLLWGIYAGLLGFASWQGWYLLFGPVLFYDMVRTARRSRYMIIRLVYGGFLLFILCYLYLILWVSTQFNVNPNQMNEGLQRREMAMLSESFFGFFMILQLAIVILLAPAYVAGAIADEKDRKTMEFILATDLRDREIIFSKLLSRMANMGLLLVTGLPIMSLMQFLGGVDPELLLAGYACIGLTILGLSSLSMLFSTLFKKPRDAISLTYLLMVAYVALSLTGWVLAMSPWRVMSWPLLPDWLTDNPPTLRDVAHWLNAGNPITVLVQVSMAISGRRMTGGATTLAAELPGLLRGYAWFHLTLAAVCVTWSVLRLRAIALVQTTAGTTQTASWWQRLRPSVGNYPMLWKELYVEGHTKLNWLMWIAVIVLVVITVGSGLWVLGYLLWEALEGNNPRGLREIPEAMNIWFRIAGTFVGCLLFLMLGVRASTCVTHERERDTFDTLLTTPMSADTMLTAKLVGNLTSLRIGWMWFGGILFLAFFTGGIHPLALPIIIGACAVYAVFVTMIGLFYSIYCKSSLQASLATVLTTLVFGGAHWIVTSCCLLPLFGVVMGLLLNQRNDPELERFISQAGFYFLKFQAGITPPFVLGYNAYSWEQLNRLDIERDRDGWEFTAFSIFGLFLTVTISMLAWFFLLLPMFRRQTRRIELDDQPN